MNVKQHIDGDEWQTIASTGNDPNPTISMARLHDMNTVFEFRDSRTGKLYRITLPDRDWLKRTDLINLNDEVHR